MEPENPGMLDGQEKAKEEGEVDAKVEAAQPSQPVVPGPLPANGGSSLAPGPLPASRRLPVAVDVATVAETGVPVSDPLALRHERLQGVITKFVASSSMGFLKSHLFEGEIGFKMESIMPELQNYEFKEDEAVEFDVQADERGRPHAVALKPVVGRKPSDCLGQRHRGYVRRFADRWGFLNAAAFDGDLFVHRDNLLLPPDAIVDGQPPLRPQQAVEFEVSTDERGRTVAKQITTSALLRPEDWIGRRLQGVIRSFQGAWGFINSAKFAGDLFVHRDSLMPQFHGVDLGNGALVEFEVERDRRKKGGKNRLVARQVALLQPGSPVAHASAMPPQHPMMMPHAHMPPFDPYGGMQPGMYPPAGYPPQPMYFNPAAMHPGPDQLGAALLYGQPPPPFHPYDPYTAHHPQAMMSGPPPQPYPAHLAPPPHYGQPLAQPGQPVLGQAPCQPPLPVPAASQAPPSVAAPVPGAPQGMPSQCPAPAEQPASEGPPGEAPQVLLHITTHDWESDQTQAGQLRVRKGTLVNVSHRAAHGWVYAATVNHGDMANEPPTEGWVPQAVAKRVSLCRAAADWPEEGAGTLGLSKGDLIAVSKEAERGWVYGERVSPKRPDATDGWLPKKVLEYILV